MNIFVAYIEDEIEKRFNTAVTCFISKKIACSFLF